MSFHERLARLLPPFFRGFVVTGRLPFEPRVTVQYPEVKRPKPERFHGRHVLNRYEDGMEKCIGCELCAGVCPARCIYVRGADNPPEDPVSPGERYGFVYEINFLRCIHCDLCVEACPTEAITESKLFEFSFSSREDAIYTKAELLVDDDGNPQHLPWEDWKPGDEGNTSGWMRATSPAGAASMEGKSLWSAELGFGVRPAQPGQSAPDSAEVTADTDRSVREVNANALGGIGVSGVPPRRHAGPTLPPGGPAGAAISAGRPAASPAVADDTGPAGAPASPPERPGTAGPGGAPGGAR